MIEFFMSLDTWQRFLIELPVLIICLGVLMSAFHR